MPSDPVVRSLAAVALVATVVGAWRSAKAMAELVGFGEPTPQRGARVPEWRPRSIAGVHAYPAGDPGTRDAVDLARLGKGLVFVFDPACGPCNRNMWNWIDIAREARKRAVPIYALALVSTRRPVTYWRGLGRTVRVLLTDTVTMTRRLGLRGTPSTVLLDRAVMRRVYYGQLTEREKREILHWLSGE